MLETMLIEYSTGLFWFGMMFGGLIVFLLMLAFMYEERPTPTTAVSMPVWRVLYNQATDPDSFLFRKKRR